MYDSDLPQTRLFRSDHEWSAIGPTAVTHRRPVFEKVLTGFINGSDDAKAELASFRDGRRTVNGRRIEVISGSTPGNLDDAITPALAGIQA